MTKTNQKAFVTMCAALVGVAILQAVAKQQAVTLGLTAFEMAALGATAVSLTTLLKFV